MLQKQSHQFRLILTVDKTISSMNIYLSENEEKITSKYRNPTGL